MLYSASAVHELFFDWTKNVTLNSNNVLSGFHNTTWVISDGSSFVGGAGGAGSKGIYSPNGFSWSSANMPQFPTTANNVGYPAGAVNNAGLYLVLGYGSGTYNITISGTGNSWSISSTVIGADQSDYVAFACNGTLFSKLSSSTGTALTTLDGITWNTNSTGIINTDFYYMISNGTEFVVIGSHFGAQKILKSTNGLTWSSYAVSSPALTDGIGGFTTNIISNGTEYMCIDLSGNIWTSTDAITWTQRITPVTYTTGYFGPVTPRLSSNGSLFILTYPTFICTTTNGIVWNNYPINFDKTFGNLSLPAYAATGRGLPWTSCSNPFVAVSCVTTTVNSLAINF